MYNKFCTVRFIYVAKIYSGKKTQRLHEWVIPVFEKIAKIEKQPANVTGRRLATTQTQWVPSKNSVGFFL